MTLPLSGTSLSLFAKLVCCYLLLLLVYGYSFGDSDHIELMSYVKWLNNNDLYKNDYYIQHIISRVPNERIALAYLLSWSGNQLEIVTFLLHIIASLLLLLGFYRIGQFFQLNGNKIWLFFLLYFLVLYRFNLGGNDIYYSAINLSKVCGVWVLYYSLKARFGVAALIGIAATLFHPMAGLQICVLSFGAYFLFILEKKYQKKIITEENIFIKKYFSALLLYTVTAGFWIGAMFLHFNEGQLSPSLFQEIIDFRLPHHFVPTAFGLKNYIILTPLLLYSWFYFYEKNRFLFYFFFISILGLIIYSFSIIVFKNYSFVSTQWFKTTIWLKLLSSIVLILAIAKFDFLVFFPKRKLNTAYIFPFIAIFSIGIMMRPFSFFKNKDYHFPFSSYQSSETDIALLAKANTPITAQFLTPASCTAFKYHSERGSYIDFKAVTHSKDAFGTWYERVQEVYRIGGKNATIKGLAATKLADENFARLTENDFLELKKKGVTHLLCEKKQALNFTKIVENQDFIIYELEDKR